MYKIFFEYIRALRFKDWWYHNGVFVLGVTFVDSSKLPTINSLIGLIVVSLYLAYGYALNEYYDSIGKRDYQNPGSKRMLKVFIYALFFLNITFVSFFAADLLVFVIIGAALSWLYSAPPFRLKKRPILRLFLNGLGFSFLFLMGVVLTGPLTIDSLLLFIYLILVFIFLELVHDLNDFKQDKEENLSTVPLILGARRANIISLFLLISLILGAVTLYLFGVVSRLFLSFNVIIYIWSGYIMLSFLSKEKGDLYQGIKDKFRLIFSVYGLGLFLLFAFGCS